MVVVYRKSVENQLALAFYRENSHAANRTIEEKVCTVH